MTNQSAIGPGPGVDRIDGPMAEGFEGPIDRGISTVSSAATEQLAVHVQAAAAATEISRQLNGPLTALLIYMGEIKQHIHLFSQAGGTRVYLRQVTENALEQTERVRAIVNQFANAHEALSAGRTGDARQGGSHVGVMFASTAGQKPLTKREREVLSLISEGYSNKESARQMRISPRTFESHRAEVMRKLGARNTADLVRTALSHPSVVKPCDAARTEG